MEQDLDFGEVLVEVEPDPVDDNGDSGLGDPGNCLGDNAFNSIKNVPAITELVLDESVG